MAVTRSFQFTDGGSNKFWSITVDGAAFTVLFGRIGTAGQRQDKSFADAKAAQVAADKLITEKLGKGYVETTTGATAGSTSAPVPSAASSAAPARKPAAAKPVKQVAVQPAAAPAITAVPTTTADTRASLSERRIRLEDDDWRYATWRELPAPVATPRPFDQVACCATLARLKTSVYGWQWHWERLGIPAAMTTREACFWLLAMSEQHRDVKPAELAKKMATIAIPETLSLAQIKKVEGAMHRGPFPAIPIRHLVTPQAFVDLIADSSALGNAIPGTVHADVVPYLSPAELAACRAALRPHVAPEKWLAGDWTDGRFAFAARLGMHRELSAVVAVMTPAEEDWDQRKAAQLHLVLGMESAAAVLANARRLKLLPITAELAKGWLATTEYSGLAELAEAVVTRTDKDTAKELAEVLALVEAPEAAPHLLRVREQSRAPAVARAWFERNIDHGLVGLADLYGGSGALAAPALEWARLIKRQGHAELLSAVAAILPPAAAERLRRLVIDHQEKVYEPFPAGEPAWLPAATATGTLPGWAAPTGLPPVTAGQRRLNDAQVTDLLRSLRDPEKGRPTIAAVKTHADPASADRFAWQLFQNWLNDGAPAKERWAMSAMGHLGGAECVMQLTPLIRAWPGESQHTRAVHGLEVLRLIGSDLALMQLNGVAQKLPFKGLKTKAAEYIEDIAKDKGLSRAELEDRIIPDCGLDERGQRTFSFGARQFAFALGPELQPVLRDAAGKLLPNLPKPNSKDDTALAEAATGEWKLLKKQVADTARIQSNRLEQALVTGRRWPSGDFRRLLVDHPLMIHLVRLLVWAGFPTGGGRPRLFRISEERTAVDLRDDLVDPDAIADIGLIHPLHLTEQERGAWGQVLSDYGVIPPFPQLGRPTFALQDDEWKANAFTRVAGVKLPAPTLVFGLEKLGWTRGAGLDGGGFCEHVKAYPAAGCTAVATYEGNVTMGYIDADETLVIDQCFLVPGIYTAAGYPDHSKRLPLAEADPVVVSEVLHDLLQLAAKAT